MCAKYLIFTKILCEVLNPILFKFWAKICVDYKDRVWIQSKYMKFIFTKIICHIHIKISLGLMWWIILKKIVILLLWSKFINSF